MGIERARAALDTLNSNPSSFDPTVWITDDRTDLAGRICLDAGAEHFTGSLRSLNGAWVYWEGRGWSVPDLADHLCDITLSEGAALFSPHNTLAGIDAMLTELEADHLLLRNDNAPMVTCEDIWHTRGGVKHVWRHRSTTVVNIPGGREIRHHDSREQAHDYATDIAACRGLTYSHNQHTWSIPA